MNSNVKISPPQLIAMLLIGDVFALFCLRDGISAMTALAFAAAAALEFLVTLPFLTMYRGGRSIEAAGKIYLSVLLIFIIIRIFAVLSMLWSTGEIIFAPFAASGIWGRILVTAVIAAACVYIVSKGIKALSRACVISAAIGALCVAVVMISALLQSDFDNFRLASSEGFFSELLRGLSLGSGLGSLLVFAGFSNGKVMSSVIWYFISNIVITVCIILTGVLVCGGIMNITDFPIAAAAQLSQPIAVQRIDSLFLSVFAVFAVFAVAVQGSAAKLVVKQLFSKKSS